MTRTASASGKLILAGEYAVVFGEPGIAIPSTLGVSATWDKEGSGELVVRGKGVDDDRRYSVHLQKIIDECSRLTGKPFSGTLTIDSSLPIGRGMGSSTALVIAICKALLGEDCEREARTVEDLVNPGNSGLDFAVIWSGKPTLFRKGEPPRAVDLHLDFLDHAVLIDTGAPGESTPDLVAWMKSRVDAGGDEAASLRDAFSMIGQCTQALLDGEHPLTVFPDHHRAQLALGVVPEQTHALILAIEAEGGAAKVLGAGARTGGGGMVLAVHRDNEIMLSIAKKHMMPVFPCR